MMRGIQMPSLPVFLFSFGIMAISSVSIIYPALIPVLVLGGVDGVDAFEGGVWAVPFVAVNALLALAAISYRRGRMPRAVVGLLRRVFGFEVSRRTSAFLVGVIVISYMVVALPDLSVPESVQWGDYDKRVGPTLEKFPPDLFSADGLMIEKFVVNNFLLVSSIQLFDNVKVIPFIGSVFLLLLTYVFTAMISERRLSGVLALLILAQSPTFLEFDSTATYPIFWTLLYLLSLYVVYKRWWYLSAPIYILSVFAKPLTIAFLPWSLAFVLRSGMSRRRKILTVAAYLAIIAAVVAIAASVGVSKEISPNASGFWKGFSVLVFQMRHDWVLLIFAPALVVGLYILSRRKVAMADALSVLIAGTLLSAAPLLEGLTSANITAYRFIPLLVFFAAGAGLFFGRISANGPKHGKHNP